jgi:integrase
MHDAETFIAAIHHNWGEAQGNYDEFRFFTGMRPSEQIALVLSDIDLVCGVVASTKLESPASIGTKPKRAKSAASSCVLARYRC